MISEEPVPGLTELLVASALAAQARRDYDDGKFASAAAGFGKAAGGVADPVDKSRLHFWAGRSWLALGKAELASAELREAESHAPTKGRMSFLQWYPSYAALKVGHDGRINSDLARARMGYLLAYEIGNKVIAPRAAAILGQMEHEYGNIAERDQLWNTVLDGPETAVKIQIYYQLGYFAWRGGDKKLARRYFWKAARKFPRTTRVSELRGDFYKGGPRRDFIKSWKGLLCPTGMR